MNEFLGDRALEGGEGTDDAEVEGTTSGSFGGGEGSRWFSEAVEWLGPAS